MDFHLRKLHLFQFLVIELEETKAIFLNAQEVVGLLLVLSELEKQNPLLKIIFMAILKFQLSFHNKVPYFLQI